MDEALVSPHSVRPDVIWFAHEASVQFLFFPVKVVRHIEGEV